MSIAFRTERQGAFPLGDAQASDCTLACYVQLLGHLNLDSVPARMLPLSVPSGGVIGNAWSVMHTRSQVKEGS